MTTTTNYTWDLPTVGGDEDTWGAKLNGNWTALDTLLGGVNATEFAILDGATLTTAELNLLDGVTWTLVDYNTLTATAAELNLLDGLTAVSGADTTIVTGTAGTDGNLAQWNADGDIVDGPDVLDEDDMASDSASAVPTQQSVKAYVDTRPDYIKAFVVFDGTGTPSISASLNVDSITDNGVGDYTINFSTSLASADYVVQITANQVTNHSVLCYVQTKGTGTLRIRTKANTNGENALPVAYDPSDINVLVVA